MRVSQRPLSQAYSRHFVLTAWLEQLALAAIDVGQLDVADVRQILIPAFAYRFLSTQNCISALSTQFPGSPRVECLIGIRKEATEPLDEILSYYEDLMDADESNAVSVTCD